MKKRETITAQQQELWALHEKATTERQRREIEKRIDELEKRKPKGTLENEVDG